MKALILAGGRGKRLGAISEAKNKCMIMVQNRPLIEYSLICVLTAGVSEIIIVVGYRCEEIINYYGDHYRKKPIKYVFQPEQKGLVNAIESACSAIGHEDFMLMLGDELMINPKHKAMVETFVNEGIFGLCGVVMVDDLELIKRTYSVIQLPDSRILRLIEKPDKPVNNIMGTGNCIFRNEILNYIEQTPINPKRGEKELPDLIQCAINNNKIVKSFSLCDHYVNVNMPRELQRAESYFSHT